ncbi:Na+/H+ antiporter NhaC family protein [Carboxydothermus ferrireducens]|uniref:NhaC family Na+:H+ antiporter n=1 Tax=Carboxydothermus ferrireducens DSM 11255 TaxID=1119529 RepID=A0ABX2RB35_9THEO|nr:Na+/H+ antiporter NhaC family protein [Carboxydothermus ferrireducens]NYE58383.1 NhaC family Na+:H+ antiporter [Carboxydothermus ferrireducens DSM 11255]
MTDTASIKPRLTFLPPFIAVVTLILAITVLNLSPVYPMVLAFFFTIIFALIDGYDYRFIYRSALEGIKSVWTIIVMFTLLGALIALWLAGGTIATMIYYGLQLVEPKFFLVEVFLLSVLLSLVIGTSLGTISTLGVVLMGIGRGLNLPPEMIAGAVVAGAFFGDRISPVSTSLYLTAEVTGTKVEDNLKLMLKTTYLPFVLTIFLYFVFGMLNPTKEAGVTFTYLKLLQSNFYLSPVLLLLPLLFLILALVRVSIKINLFINVVLSFILGIVYQKVPIQKLLLESFTGFEAPKGLKALAGGGVLRYLSLVSIILVASAMAGILINTGVFTTLLIRPLAHIKSYFSLTFGIMILAVLLLMVTCTQALAIMIPGMTLRDEFKRKANANELSRILADSAVVLAPLIPWNMAAILSGAALQVNPKAYILYAFYLWLTPLTNLLVSLRKQGEVYGEKGLGNYR